MKDGAHIGDWTFTRAGGPVEPGDDGAWALAAPGGRRGIMMDVSLTNDRYPRSCTLHASKANIRQ